MRIAKLLLGVLGSSAARVLPTLAIIIVFNFFLLKMAPGDAADVIAGESGAATAETMAELRSRFGLDLPIIDQFARYIWGLLHLDLGTSTRFNLPVGEVIMSRLPSTLLLMTVALGFALCVGIGMGVLMSLRAGRFLDRALSFVALFFYSVPAFWGALMLVIIFSVRLGWLPSGGYQTIGFEGSTFATFLDRARYIVLPALSLAMFFIAVYARLTRASMLEASRQDFVRTALAKGVPTGRILFVHTLRNALLPVTTVAGVHFGILLGGAIVTETVFAWPGLGSLALQAVAARDYVLLLGIFLLSSLCVIVFNVATDLLQVWLDPRLRTAS